MKYLIPDKFREGIKVICNIENQEIIDAKLHFENGNWFICQNKMPGMSCINKLSYECSWVISLGSEKDLSHYCVTNLREAFSLQNKIIILKMELCK
jgi:hypothetical protein